MAPPNTVASFLKDLKKKHKENKSEPKKKRKQELEIAQGRHENAHTDKKRKQQPDEAPSARPAKRRNLVKITGSVSRLPESVEPESSPFKFPIRYTCAPMVGASELAFRLLCRKYGCQAAYTPMMSAHKFAHDDAYFKENFQTCAQDRPLVCHFSANTPADFAAAAVKSAPYADAIDLNLGCPQRTAFLGHFGSYLLDQNDRTLLCSMIKAASSAADIPVFCKIRLLKSLPETIDLCRQLRDAGASLIAIHARHRASWERKGAGARDGAAMLDQVLAIRKAVPNVAIVTNGNTKTWKDVTDNLESTTAEGLMSAEGLLDNPALFLPRMGSRDDKDKQVCVPDPLASGTPTDDDEKKRKLLKKLRKIEKLELKIEKKGEASLTPEEQEKIATKESVKASLGELEALIDEQASNAPKEEEEATVSLASLYKASDNKLKLALEYLELATEFPVVIRSVIFHTRRMVKDELVQFQLLDDCLACHNIPQVRAILLRVKAYQSDPASFMFDRQKAKEQKEALERKKREEGKRKLYEARMMRKAKREGKADLMHYLNIGAELPTEGVIESLKSLSRDEMMAIWKQRHSQHCLAFHTESGGCQRGRACAFLHVDLQGGNAFVEKDEVAG